MLYIEPLRDNGLNSLAANFPDLASFPFFLGFLRVFLRPRRCTGSLSIGNPIRAHRVDTIGYFAGDSRECACPNR